MNILRRRLGFKRYTGMRLVSCLGCVRLAVLFLALGLSQTLCANVDILILQSHDSQPYRQMLAGFLGSLDSNGLAVRYSATVLSAGDNQNIQQLLENQQPKLIFALGTPAARAALDSDQRIPVVSGLVLGASSLLQKPNATSVGLDFPPATQWLWMRRLLPEVRRIAVLFDPAHGSQLFDALLQQANGEKIQLIATPVNQQEELPALLQQMPAQLDAIWALDGVAAFNATSVRELLLYSFRNRTPLIGLSEQWVKAGALYALDWDYADLGSQAAELALAILVMGKTVKELPMQWPRKVRPVFNSKTAEHMKLTFPQRWLPEMTEVAP